MLTKAITVLAILCISTVLAITATAGDTTLTAAGLWDNSLSSDNQANQAGATVHIFWVDYSNLILIGFEGLNAIIEDNGRTRDSAVINFYNSTHYTNGDAKLYGVWKWQATEVDSDFDDWDAPRGWGTNACNSANDAGSFNTGNGSGDDRTATAIDTENITSEGAYSLKDDAWFVNTVGDSVIWAIKAENSMDCEINSTENGSNPITVTLYYGEGGEPAASNRRRKLLLE